MKHRPVSRASILAVLACLLAAGGAAAQPPAPTINSPVGLWKLYSYDDAQAAMPLSGVQEVCFQAGGTWFSPQFPGWGGIWFQKGINGAGNGDRVRVLGNWNQAGGNDSAELDFIHTPLMAGTWTEWTDSAYPPPPPFNLWARVKLCYLGSSCGAIPTGSQAGPPPLTVTSSAALAAVCAQ
jgi:hypothetical protein